MTKAKKRPKVEDMPAAEKTSMSLEVFTIKKAVEQIDLGKGKKEWRYAYFHFTNADKPVTFNGIQYIPISYFDQVRWDI